MSVIPIANIYQLFDLLGISGRITRGHKNNLNASYTAYNETILANAVKTTRGILTLGFAFGN